eukprot:TRINITY_DN81138_c0_g1_i1.p1 TRINITY_DN81138_c0_g1~~TRINITY_DN81138_c0_g1_i1.p1  ORF type:complete len:626 (+),score=88.78 TRINITY_DN81138_c0_g1_i1:51-1928(+)
MDASGGGLSGGKLSRLAAGGDVAKFAQVLQDEGWTSEAIDACRDSSGKNPLHKAAWRGNILNVRRLLKMQCNLEAVSTGSQSCGKTPIFYAITRCRDDVVSLLISSKASTKVVNNKCQTPLSLGASHLRPETIQALLEREAEEGEEVPWRNFHASHWDGKTYGDLDPRFLPPEQFEALDSPEVTALAINPTTDESRRRGENFRRLALEEQRDESTKSASSEPVLEATTKPSLEEVEEVWTVLCDTLQAGVADDVRMAADHVLTITALRYARSAWLQSAADRLASHLAKDSAALEAVQACFGADKDIHDKSSGKHLRTRFFRSALRCLEDDAPCGYITSLSTAVCRDVPRAVPARWTVKPPPPIPADGLPTGKKLRLADFRRCNVSWVSSAGELQNMRDHLHSLIHQQASGAKLRVALDTEWRTLTKGVCNGHKRETTCLALLQIAVDEDMSLMVEQALSQCDATSVPGAAACLAGSVRCWLVDACAADGDSEFSCALKAFCSWLLMPAFGAAWILVGFALSMDLSLLRELARQENEAAPSEISVNVLDLQHLAVLGGVGSSARMPSLQRIVENWMPGLTLDKSHQCSDWTKRPLSQEQKEYAALDSAVLLELESRMVLAPGYDSK